MAFKVNVITKTVLMLCEAALRRMGALPDIEKFCFRAEWVIPIHMGVLFLYAFRDAALVVAPQIFIVEFYDIDIISHEGFMC